VTARRGFCRRREKEEWGRALGITNCVCCVRVAARCGSRAEGICWSQCYFTKIRARPFASPAARPSINDNVGSSATFTSLRRRDHLCPPIRYLSILQKNNGFWKRKVLTRSLILGIKVEIVISVLMGRSRPNE
jgi:hypothetical protein